MTKSRWRVSPDKYTEMEVQDASSILSFDFPKHIRDSTFFPVAETAFAHTIRTLALSFDIV